MDSAQPTVPEANIQGEALKNKLQRESLNTIAVYNPFDEPYRLIWGPEEQPESITIVPAKSEYQMFQYLAEKFCREVKNRLINEMSDKALNDLRESMRSKGVADVDYNANSQFMRNNEFRTNDEDLIKKIYFEDPKIWRGVVARFGLDDVIPAAKPRTIQPLIPVEEKILEEQKNKAYVPQTPEAPKTLTESPTIDPEPKVVVSLPDESKYPINKKKAVAEVSQ